MWKNYRYDSFRKDATAYDFNPYNHINISDLLDLLDILIWGEISRIISSKFWQTCRHGLAPLRDQLSGANYSDFTPGPNFWGYCSYFQPHTSSAPIKNSWKRGTIAKKLKETELCKFDRPGYVILQNRWKPRIWFVAKQNGALACHLTQKCSNFKLGVVQNRQYEEQQWYTRLLCS